MSNEYIMNERKYVEDVILKTKNYDDKKSLKDDFALVIKYYSNIYEFDVDKTMYYSSEFLHKHEENEKDWWKFMKNVATSCCNFERNLKEINSISITQSEWNHIDILESKELKKILFTLIVLAKYINPLNPSNAKITVTLSKIFKFANLSSLKRNVKLDIIKELKDLGLINSKVDRDSNTKDRKIVYTVNCAEIETEELFYVYDISSLGRKYSDMRKLMLDKDNKIKQCEICGELIEKNNKDTKKYCDKCKYIIDKENTKKRVEKYRNTLNM